MEMQNFHQEVDRYLEMPDNETRFASLFNSMAKDFLSIEEIEKYLKLGGNNVNTLTGFRIFLRLQPAWIAAKNACPSGYKQCLEDRVTSNMASRWLRYFNKAVDQQEKNSEFAALGLRLARLHDECHKRLAHAERERRSAREQEWNNWRDGKLELAKSLAVPAIASAASAAVALAALSAAHKARVLRETSQRPVLVPAQV